MTMKQCMASKLIFIRLRFGLVKGLPSRRRRIFLITLDIWEVLSHDKYLRLSNRVDCSKKSPFLPIKDGISKRLKGWIDCHLSSVG